MARPRVLVDNLYSIHQYPLHVITAEEEASSFEAFRVATGRRSFGDRWQSTTTNSDTFITTQCNRVRMADMIVVDRGHNLVAERVRLRRSDDNFTTFEEVFNIVLPSQTAPGRLDDADGVRTEEGAWGFRFDPRAGIYWRVFIDAMAVDLVPQMPGIWLGLSWQPNFFERPFEDERHDLIVQALETEAAWRGTNPPARRGSGTLRFKQTDLDQYDEARLNIVEKFGTGFPMWLVWDEDQSDRMSLTVMEAGVMSFPLNPDYFFRTGEVSFVEHEPLRL